MIGLSAAGFYPRRNRPRPGDRPAGRLPQSRRGDGGARRVAAARDRLVLFRAGAVSDLSNKPALLKPLAKRFPQRPETL